MAKPQTFREWVKKDRHLPPALRDFHAQKEVFKCVWDGIIESRNRDPESVRGFTGEFNWIMAHCFVIDRFLRFMAAHGYTLQRVRKQPFQFADLSATIKDRRDAEAEAFQAMLAERKAQTRYAVQIHDHALKYLTGDPANPTTRKRAEAKLWEDQLEAESARASFQASIASNLVVSNLETVPDTAEFLARGDC